MTEFLLSKGPYHKHTKETTEETRWEHSEIIWAWNVPGEPASGLQKSSDLLNNPYKQTLCYLSDAMTHYRSIQVHQKLVN